jgi:hypothetical protein
MYTKKNDLPAVCVGTPSVHEHKNPLRLRRTPAAAKLVGQMITMYIFTFVAFQQEITILLTLNCL